MKRQHRFSGPEEEQRDIQRIWEAVQNKTGIKIGTDVVPNKDPFDILENPLSVGLVRPGDYINYTVGVTDHMPDSALAGIMAHELGHFAADVDKYNDSEENELSADKWAAEHGYGEGLVEALQIASKHHPQIDGTDGVHPKRASRIEKIRQEEINY